MPSDQQILNAKILIIDDQTLDVRILEKILKTANYSAVHSINDSRLALETYREFQPDLVLLDLRMPHLDGFAVMSQLKEIEKTGYLPVLVLSAEQGREIRLQALQSGAKDFLHKPYDSIEVLCRIRNMIEVRLLHKETNEQNRLLEEKVQVRTKEIRETRLDLIHRLARTAEYRDTETGRHVLRVSHYCACLGAAIGMSASQCDLLLHASPLHDIGKIAIPDDILRKPDQLTPEERKIMQTHTTVGAELLSGSNFALMKMAEQIALTHHEKWDGTGYPRGLKGDDIALVGRICGLCDVFDALTSKRSYKKAWSIDETFLEIKNQSGRHFDPYLVECFLKIKSKIEGIVNEYV